MDSRMPCANTAEELRTDAGTKPSGMPEAEMTLREIAEAFVSDPDADVVGVIHGILCAKYANDLGRALIARNFADEIIDFVEGQK